MASRYSDGRFPVWYGSLDSMTTIYETAYHMLRTELNIAGVNEIIIRERALYKIHCKALLLDLSTKQHHYPQLITDDYTFTQQLGHRIAKEGHPGLLAPSARNKNKGINTVIFNPDVLSHPRLNHYLTYSLDPIKKSIEVEKQPGKKLLCII